MTGWSFVVVVVAYFLFRFDIAVTFALLLANCVAFFN